MTVLGYLSATRTEFVFCAVTMQQCRQSAGKIHECDIIPCVMSDDRWLQKVPADIGHYLAGFVDGEGSFNVSLRKLDDRTLGWQVVLTMNVAQRDKTVLALLKRHLGCGRIQARKDGVHYYIVSNPTSIHERVVPFFKKFGFLSAQKKKNFRVFKEIASLMVDDKHHTPDGLQKIVDLREQLNVGRGRKRKYNKDDYQQSLRENPQRLYAKASPRQKRPEQKR